MLFSAKIKKPFCIIITIYVYLTGLEEIKLKGLNLKNLLDSKKFDISVIVINAILILLLSVYLVFMHSNKNINSQFDTENIVGVESTEADESTRDLLQNADTLMGDNFFLLLTLNGGDYFLEDNVQFHFTADGRYSGFFDSNNLEVENYYYEVLYNGESQYVLRIKSTDNSRYVDYIMEINEDGNIVLMHPGNERSFILAN